MPRAISSWTPTPVTAPGERTPYDIEAVQAAMRAEACRCARWIASRTGCERRMIGGRRPLQGRKLGRSAGPGRATARAVFPLYRTGPAVAKPAARRPKTRWAVRWLGQVTCPRPAAGVGGGDRRAAVQEEALAIFSSDAISSSAYATEEILRAFMLVGLGRRPHFRLPISDRHRRAARDRRLQLPPGLHRLSHGRRLVLGRRRRTSAGSRRSSRPRP